MHEAGTQMTLLSSGSRPRLAAVMLAACLAAIATAPVHAAPFRLLYTGTLYAGKDVLASPTGANLLTGDTVFTFDALFDTSSPNLSGLSVPGYVAYAPSAATITIGGVGYALSSYSASNRDGVSVTLFDKSNVFDHGLYGVGFFADAPADGAGVVGDFSGATTDFSVTALTSTTLTGFNGAGYSPTTGCGPTHRACTGTEHLALTAPDGAAYQLSFSGRDEVGGSSTAVITALPEPGSWAMMIGGLGLVGGTLRRRSVRRVRAFA